MPQELKDIFTQFLKTKQIFANRSALTIAFTPETIPHREQQIADLGRILAPTLKGARPSNIFIYGRTGTGKTLITRLVASELERLSKENGYAIKTIYLNCKMKREADTEYRLLAALTKELGKEVPFTGLPTDKIYRTFFETIDSKDQTVILVIDEIDALVQKTGDEILYNLTRINQELKRARISIIGITNNLNFINSLEPRVKSSLSEEELIFPPYNAVELQDILRTRANLAFVQGAISEGVIEKCAALAAQEHGDARRALDLLRVAAELAERAGDEKITTEHVDSAEDKVDLDRIIEIIKTQPRQSQIVLSAIVQLAEKNRVIQTSDVFSAYLEICRQHRAKQLTQRRISDLIAELELFGIIDAKIISRGRHGRTRVISLSLPESVIEKIKNILQQLSL